MKTSFDAENKTNFYLSRVSPRLSSSEPCRWRGRPSWEFAPAQFQTHLLSAEFLQKCISWGTPSPRPRFESSDKFLQSKEKARCGYKTRNSCVWNDINFIPLGITTGASLVGKKREAQYWPRHANGLHATFRSGSARSVAQFVYYLSSLLVCRLC